MRCALTAIDLFAGAGGLSAGLETAGFRVRVAVEIDPVSAGSYALNHPSTTLIPSDIRNIGGPELLRQAGVRRGELSLLTGCPPCQGFSTLRTRRRAGSVPDERNDLILELLRLVRSTRPRAVVMENVPGLTEDSRFDHFRRGLTTSGYSHDHAILDAMSFGVPQRRRRLVLIALRGRPVPPLWAQHRLEKRTVRDAIGSLPPPGSSGDALHDLPEHRSESVMNRIRATPRDGGSRRDLPSGYGCRCHSRSDGFYDVYGRMSWDDVAPTITSGCHNPSKGRFLHPEQHRAITLREAALLQSFPRDYRFNLSRGKEHAAWQIGNAFPPLLIAPIARILAKELMK